MTQTFTQEHRAKLEEYLATHILPKGLGTKESACSIAAINLAMTGTLTDKIPDCMSTLLGFITIKLQDGMPEEMRNSERYKALLPEMAGTGCEHEQQRLDIFMDWLWSVVLPHLQPIANQHGFGSEWETFCKLKTAAATRAVSVAAHAHAVAARASVARVVRAALAAYAVATRAAVGRDDAACDDVAYAVAISAVDADHAVAVVAYAYASADAGDFWETVDPIGVLERMTYLNVETSK